MPPHLVQKYTSWIKESFVFAIMALHCLSVTKWHVGALDVKDLNHWRGLYFPFHSMNIILTWICHNLAFACFSILSVG
jgi:hypothetical protein